MKAGLVVLVAGAVLLAGCGADDSPDAPAPEASEAPSEAATNQEKPDREPKPKPKPDPKPGTSIVVGGSEYGQMLYDSNDQAIYIFENDPEDESVCDGECAEAWPPVLTDGEPRAGNGVDASLLGTIERDGGSKQVTYAGQPLYFYAHEGPGEVLCHNVNLNGGYWWVVGPDGRRLA